MTSLEYKSSAMSFKLRPIPRYAYALLDNPYLYYLSLKSLKNGRVEEATQFSTDTSKFR